jgi:hypothetical protein
VLASRDKMGIRAFIASLAGGAVGFSLFLILVALDGSQKGFTLPGGDIAYWLWALTWICEWIALVTISMCRVSPWIAWFLGDRWEADRIKRERPIQVSRAEMVCSVTILARGVVRVIDAGHVTTSLVVGLSFAALPFIIPRPRSKLNA